MPDSTVRLQDSTSFPITAEAWAKNKGLLKADGTPASPSQIIAESVVYGNKTVSQVLDELTYTPINISTFNASPSTIELGGSVSVNLNWTASNSITGQSINGQNISAATRAVTFNNVSVTTSYNLIAFDTNAPGGTQTTNSTVSVTVLPRRFWGVSSSSSLNSAQILALSGTELSGDKSKSFTINAGVSPGQYVYFVYIDTLPDPVTYKLFGFDETYVKSTISVTTNTGLVANYTVIRSINKLTGTVSVNID